MNLSDRITNLERSARTEQFSHAEKVRQWKLMVWRARLRLVDVEDMPPEPSAEWLEEMARDSVDVDVPHVRAKLYATFPEWRGKLEALSDLEVCALNHDWPTWARQNQLLPGAGQMCLEAFLQLAKEYGAQAV